MKTYRFKPEFENKLKGVKRKFITNIHNHCNKVNKDFNVKCDEINNQKTFEDAISIAFIWIDTPEGHDFWSEVSER